MRLRSHFILYRNIKQNVVAIKSGKGIYVSPSPDYVIKDKDVLVALGSSENLSKFESMIGKKSK